MITAEDKALVKLVLSQNIEPDKTDAGVEAMKKVLRQLSYREREILKLRYGLGDGYTYTLEEVSHIFRVTRERIRQIEKKAIAKFRKLLDD